MSSGVTVSAHLVVYLNGTRFAECTRFTWRSMTPNNEKRGIDSMVPFELAPGTAMVQGSAGGLRIRGTGGLQGKGVTSPFPQLQKQRYFSILVLHRLDGSRVFAADQCLVDEEEWNAVAKGRLEGSFTFRGVRWENEAAPAYER